MTEAPPENTAFLLGQITGQLRELIHSINNVSQKQDALAMRITALETSAAEQKGRDGVLGAIIKSPFFAWLVAAGAGIWAFLTGKVNP